MEEYIGQTDSVETEQTALFESPADGAPSAQNVPSEDTENAPGGTNHCTFCTRRVSLDDPTTHSEVTAWVRGPKKDSSVLRQYTGRVACGDCIAKLRSGVSPNAKDFETLLEEPAERSDADGLFTDMSSEYLAGHRDGYADPDGTPPVPRAAIDEYTEGWHDGQAKRKMDNLRQKFNGE